MSYKIGIAILYVRDLEKEKRFYRDVLELPFLEARSDPDFAMFGTDGDSILALQDVRTTDSPETRRAGGVEIALQVKDVDAIWQDWQSKHAPTLTKIEELPFGRVFHAQDPEGHLLTIYQPTER
jgi:predicted enzyme related to lactoylglutathione lyase